MKHKAIFSLKYKRKNKINEVSSSEIFIWRFKGQNSLPWMICHD